MKFKKSAIFGLLFVATAAIAAHVNDRGIYMTDVTNADGVSVFSFPTTHPSADKVMRTNADGESTSSTIDFDLLAASILPTQAGHAGEALFTDASSLYWGDGGFLTGLSGDVTATGPGVAVATLATVNSNVGSFGSASSVMTQTVNAKGLTTAAASVPILITESQVTNLVSDLAGKQPTGNYITALTGDATAAGPGSSAITFATVNSNVGSFGSSTAIPSLTVNGKGLVTAASTNAVIAPAGTLTGTTLASNVVTSSLTTVGTIGAGAWQGTAVGPTYGGTGINTSASTGIPNITAGTWSVGNLTGDITSNVLATTLATVNSNVGSFGTASSVPTITLNGKGLATAASNTSIQIAESQVTNLVSDLAGKQPTGSYITALTGDVTAAGPGSSAATLATVNSNVGSFGSSTAIPSFTVNGKGLVTAASTNAVIAPAGTLTGTTLASNVVTSSLTTVGTIGSGIWNAGAVSSTGALNVNGNAVVGKATGTTSSLAIGATSQAIDGGSALNFLNSSSTTNWQIASNLISGGGLTFTPSTAGGGSTFITPALTLSSAGAATLPNATMLGSASTNSGGYPLNVRGNSGAGVSFGPFIQAGTNSSDYALTVTNSANTSNLFLVRGDGVVSGGLLSFSAANGTTPTGIFENTSGSRTIRSIGNSNSTGVATVGPNLLLQNSDSTTNNFAMMGWADATTPVAVANEVGRLGYQNLDQTNHYGKFYLLTRNADGFSTRVTVDNTSLTSTVLVTPSAGVKGVSTNTSATAGNVGEYVESKVTTPTNFPGLTTAYGDGTSISLTAGDWDVTALVDATANGATVVVWSLGISSTSGNSATGLQSGDNFLTVANPSATGGRSGTIPSYRVSLSGTTTYYLKLNATYSVATPQYTCRLSARRVQPGS